MPNLHDLSHLPSRQGYTLIRIETLSSGSNIILPVKIRCPDGTETYARLDVGKGRFLDWSQPGAVSQFGADTNEIFDDEDRLAIARAAIDALS